MNTVVQRPGTIMQRQVAKCFLCDQESSHLVHHEGDYDARRCPSCGMVYTTPTPLPGEVDPTIESHPESFYSLSARFKASWVARHCPPGQLLEVGCGKGYFLSEARNLGFKVLGLEPKQSSSQYAKEVFGIPVHTGLLEDNLLEKKGYDVVYHCDLLAHFPDPVMALKSMSELLRPGGVLCFEVGLMAGISPLWYRFIGRVGLGPHLWFYSQRAFELLLARAGLRLMKVQYFGLVPRAILSKITGILLKRIAVPLLSVMNRWGISPPPDRATHLQDRFRNFLRYRAGVLMPRIGPQTLMVVAQPVDDARLN